MDLAGAPDFSTVTNDSPTATARIPDLVPGAPTRLNGQEERRITPFAEAGQKSPPILTRQRTPQVINDEHRPAAPHPSLFNCGTVSVRQLGERERREFGEHTA